ncbi:TFIIB-type zinc ribbon-containing protein, partial [Streptomyces sp. NPDC001515]
MQCPKCHAPMHTYNRNGIQIEQCSGCRGIFLDYGELETLTRISWPPSSPPGSRPPGSGSSSPASATSRTPPRS